MAIKNYLSGIISKQCFMLFQDDHILAVFLCPQQRGNRIYIKLTDELALLVIQSKLLY
jgi:hypothetical protein